VPLAATLTARCYIIPLCRSRPPALQTPVQGKERKKIIKQTFHVHTRTNQSVPVPIGPAQGNLSADPAHGETPPPVAGGENPCRRHLNPAGIHRKGEERNKKHPIVILSSISQLPNPCSNDRHSRSSYISALFFVGIVRVELPLMTCHRWEVPLPAAVVAVGDHRSYMSIASYSSISNT